MAFYAGPVKRKCSPPNEYGAAAGNGECGGNGGVSMERTASANKRRRAPSHKDSPHFGSTITAGVGQRESIDAERLNSYVGDLYHPQPQQIRLSVPFDIQNIHPIHQHQLYAQEQTQLNTPPMESIPFQFSALQPHGQSSATQSYTEDIDEDMMLDDCPNSSQNQPTPPPQQHAAWMKTLPSISYAPPSPPTPIVPDNSCEPVSNLKLNGDVGMFPPPQQPENGGEEDPMSRVWNRAGPGRKNISVQVKGFKMGYMPDCERCIRKEEGHFGHYVL